jgi:hypothetical protein
MILPLPLHAAHKVGQPRCLPAAHGVGQARHLLVFYTDKPTKGVPEVNDCGGIARPRTRRYAQGHRTQDVYVFWPLE